VETTRIPGSFRDPSGFLFRENGEIYRQVNARFRSDYDLMMSSGFYAAATEQRLLLPHQEVLDAPPRNSAYKVLKPVQIPFISYPYEWSFSQLQDAALLTLRLQELALDFGLCLKDASAYNVQFHRGAAVFIDSLSFEAYREGEPWIAYEQYCKHFLAPLALMSHVHIDLAKLLRVHIDGVPLGVASRLLPARTRLRPSLLIHLHLHARMQASHADRARHREKPRSRTISRQGLRGIVDGLASATRKLSWTPAGTEWASYYDDTNYSDDAQSQKLQILNDYLDQTTPDCVWDLGANTGIFSRLASERGIPTVAFDIDPAAVEKNYLTLRERGETNLLPLVQDLTNPSPDLGWNSEERSSLRSRGPAHVVMALALIHHLAIRNNVPLLYAARFFAGLCRSLIIEFVPKGDSQVQRLLATRDDIFPDYTREGFEQAFSQAFSIRSATRIEGSERILYLMDRH
jgi:ribosomal protein L11 methylase PrmA